MIPWECFKNNYSNPGTFFVAFLALALYSNNIFADFVYDDRPAILNNDDVAGHSSWVALLFHNDFWGNPIAMKGSHKSYRPLITASFRLQHWLHGNRPEFFHIINILIHVINSILVEKLAHVLFGDKNSFYSTLSAALFAIHPINSEAVCSIVGRADLLATTFTCSAILLAKWQNIAVSIGLAICGILCKETAVVILPLLILENFLLGGTNSQKTWKRVREMAVALVLICYCRLTVNNFQSPSFSKSDNPIAHDPSPFIRFLNFAYLPFFHFQLLVFPQKLCFDWSVPKIETAFDSRFISALTFYNTILWTVWKLLAHIFINDKKSSSHRKILFFLALLISPHLLSSNLVAYVGFVAAERILYLPAVGYCILLVYCIKSITILEKPKFVKNAIFLGLMLGYAARTLNRVEDWKSEENLFKSALDINPVKAHANLGHVYFSQRRRDLAKEHYLAALRLRPNMADTWYNLGILNTEAQNLTDARDCYRNAVKFRPNFAAAHLNLALLLWDSGDHAASFNHLDYCLNSSGENLKSYQSHVKMKATCAFNKARLLQKTQKFSEAITTYEMALKVSPPGFTHTSAILNSIGNCHSQVGNYELAEFYISQAMSANHPNSFLTMAQLRIRQNRSYEAASLMDSALGLAPPSPTVLQNAAWVAQQMGDFNRSLHFFKLALSIEPTNLESLRGVANLLREQQDPKSMLEAEQYFWRILKLLPKVYESHANYGAILHANGKYQNALEHYQKALELNPGDGTTRKNLEKLKRVMEKNQNY